MAKQTPTLPIVTGWYLPGDRRDDFRNEKVHPITGEVTTPPSMTKQEFVSESDINNIIREYSITGQINHIAAKAAQGAYLDLPPPTDFQESLNLVMRAEEAFATLPSQVRNRFENDPAQFLAFCEDPANKDELVKMGLAKASPPPPPAPPPAEPLVPSGARPTATATGTTSEGS